MPHPNQSSFNIWVSRKLRNCFWVLRIGQTILITIILTIKHDSLSYCTTCTSPFWCCSSLRHHTDVYHNKEMQVKCPIDHCSVAYCFVGMYSVHRSVKGMQILCSNTQTGPSRAGKQKQEQISPNHIPPFSQSLYTTLLCSLTRWRLDAMQLVSCTSWGKLVTQQNYEMHTLFMG